MVPGGLAEPIVITSRRYTELTKNKRNTWTAVLLLCLAAAGFVGYKWWVWRPYAPFYQGQTENAQLKWWLTILAASPFRTASGAPPIKDIAGEPYIVADPQDLAPRELLRLFPPPPEVLKTDIPTRQRVEALRSFVHGILPLNSSLPESPEPVRALVLLGQNQTHEKYPLLCSKQAKIMLQYLNALGLTGRIVQLHRHVSLEWFNPEKGQWEFQSPYDDSPVMFEGRHLSAAQAHDLQRQGREIEFRGDHKVFLTVAYLPRTALETHLPSWHYFHYDNLDYWRVLRVSEKSRAYWKKKMRSSVDSE